MIPWISHWSSTRLLWQFTCTASRVKQIWIWTEIMEKTHTFKSFSMMVQFYRSQLCIKFHSLNCFCLLVFPHFWGKISKHLLVLSGVMMGQPQMSQAIISLVCHLFFLSQESCWACWAWETTKVPQQKMSCYWQHEFIIANFELENFLIHFAYKLSLGRGFRQKVAKRLFWL